MMMKWMASGGGEGRRSARLGPLQAAARRAWNYRGGRRADRRQDRGEAQDNGPDGSVVAGGTRAIPTVGSLAPQDADRFGLTENGKLAVQALPAGLTQRVVAVADRGQGCRQSEQDQDERQQPSP